MPAAEMVATAVVPLTQAPPAVASFSAVVLPTQTTGVPVIAATVITVKVVVV